MLKNAKIFSIVSVLELMNRAAPRRGLEGKFSFQHCAAAALVDGAGHAAQVMAKICPAGMIFVPSVDGFSHSAREFTKWEDCMNGANVLLQAAVVGI